jgi:hypothetical protein
VANNLTKKEKDAIFRQLFDECYEELKPYNLPIAKKEDIIIKSSNISKYWGLCEKKHDETTYTIKIANSLIGEGADLKYAKGIIIHELIHTIKGCVSHARNWQGFASMLQKELGYPIMDGISIEEVYGQIPSFAQKCYCENCGAKYLLCTKDDINAARTGKRVCNVCYNRIVEEC